MSKVYDNPPIVEAVCEFRFEPSQPWDLTVPGLVYDRIKGEFPKKRQKQVVEMEVRAEDERVAQSVRGGATLMQFVRDDERALIQVGPDLLSVNHARPYSDWHTFKATIADALQVYQGVNQPVGARRIGLRYINRIEIPEEQIVIEDYLLATPHIPEQVPQFFSTWAQRVQIPISAVGVLVVQSGSLPDPKQEKVVFLLDLDLYIDPETGSTPLDKAMHWVEDAHRAIESAFEACITDKTRALFGEAHTNE